MAEIPQVLQPNLTPEALQQSVQPAAQGLSTPITSTTGQLSTDLLPLYDQKNHVVMNVPHAEAEAYLKSGQFTLPKDMRINVVDQSGEAASVDGSEAFNALRSGYRLETAEEAQARKVQEQYGSTGQEVLAGLAGAARGASFGLSDQALVKSGLVNQETMAGLEQANPTASLTGEVVGVLGSALLTGGESAAAKVLSSGVKGAEQVGAATERLIAKQAMKAGLSSPIAKSIATKIVPKAAGSAVEGAFYGAGQLLSEEALGKADLNAESLASYIGTGALINGAFGAAFAGAKELAEPLGKAASYVTSPFKSKISQELDSKVDAAKLLGLTPTQLYKLEQRNPRVVEQMQDFLKNDLKLTLTDTAEDLARKNEALRELAGKEIGSVLKEVDTVLDQMPLFKPSAASVWDNVYQKVFSSVEGLISKDVPGMSKYQKPITQFLDDIARLSKSERKFSASDLQRFKKGLDDLIKYEKDPGKWSVLEEMAFEARTAVRIEIDKLAQSMESLNGAGDLAQRLRSANRQYSSSATFGDFLEKRALKAADVGFGFGLDVAKNVALDMKRKYLVLGKIEQGQQRLQKQVENVVRNFALATKGVPVAAQTAVPSIVDSALALNYEQGKPKKPATVKQAYNNVLTNVQSYTANPTAFMEKSNRQTASLYSAAPQTSGQLDNLAMTAMAYLSMKLPKKAQNPTLLSGYMPVNPPSTQELAKFSRILQAIEKPATILQDISNGTASREQVEVLKEVYPATFAKVQEAFIQALPKLSESMSYNRRIQLGLLMGVPADPSMQPQNVLGLQALFGQQPQAETGAVNSTVTGMQELSKSTELMTPLQQSQAGIESE